MSPRTSSTKEARSISANYRITQVHGSREWQPRQGGTNIDFTITLDGVEGQHVLTQKKDGPHVAPQVGDEIFGHIEDGGTWPSGDPKPPKLKRDQQDAGNAPRSSTGGSSSYGGGRDNRSIEAQVAMKEAGNLMVGFMATGWAPESADQLAATTIRLFAALNDALKDGAK